MLVHLGDAPDAPAGLLATAAATGGDGRAYAAEGAVLASGAAIQWLRDGLGLLRDAHESEALARSIPPPTASASSPRWPAWAPRTGRPAPAA